MISLSWYVAYSLSYRDLEELMLERGYFSRPERPTLMGIELWGMKKGRNKS